jgi:cytochrome c peroxidase
MEVSMEKGSLIRTAGVASALFAAVAVHAETPTDLLRSYEAAARQAAAQFDGFSAERGRAFFQSPHGADWSCASCHTENPLTEGRHANTGKTIAPLAPAANAKRFTRLPQAEKWFKRNCNDVMARPCTPLEKGDVLAYLMQLQPPGAK